MKKSTIPKGTKKVKKVKGKTILAYGEATGHHHSIAEKGATLWQLKGDLYLEVTEPVTISHDEHKPLPIPEGVYKIGRVKEYDYVQEMERKVID